MGILSSSKQRFRNIPVDEYEAIHGDVSHNTIFGKIRESICSSTFVPDQCELRSMRELHEHQCKVYMNDDDINARLVLSQERNIIKKKKGWNCKNNNSNFRCGCMKRDVRCTSNCACNGKCSNGNKDEVEEKPIIV